MATSYAIGLAAHHPEWANVFELQRESRYSDALEAINRVPVVSQESTLYSNLIRLNLRMCVDALAGMYPEEKLAEELRGIAEKSASISCSTVQIETLFLLADVYPSSRAQAMATLEQLEPNMDHHTLRRWIHRKGKRLVKAGHIQEAHDLWSKLAIETPASVEDHDDSFCSLLIDFGRISTELGKYSDAVDIYGQALACARSPHNQGLALIRLSNALERLSRPAQADKRRMEYFSLIKREYPTQCAACSVPFGKEPKFLIPCCKTIVHSECLRQEVSDIEPSETDCPFCKTKFFISDVVDPTAVEGRKYKKHRRGNTPAEVEPSEDN
jgi:hypothetical protein